MDDPKPSLAKDYCGQVVRRLMQGGQGGQGSTGSTGPRIVGEVRFRFYCGLAQANGRRAAVAGSRVMY